MCGRFQLDVNDSEFRSIFKSLNYTPTNSVSESGGFYSLAFSPLALPEPKRKNRRKGFEMGTVRPVRQRSVDKRPQRNGFDKTFFPLRL